MIIIHYVLVATCALQASVFGSSLNESQALNYLKRKLSIKEDSKKNLVKRNSLAPTVTGDDKTFSFKEFLEYAKSKHEKGVQFKQMLEILTCIDMGTGIESRPEYVSLVNDWIHLEKDLPIFSSENPTNIVDSYEKIRMLMRALTENKLDTDGKEFVRNWILEAKHAVHQKFLNGKPGDDTVKLFTSLKSTDFDFVKRFLKNRDFHMKEICEAISKEFYKLAVQFSSPRSKKEPLKEEYDCKIGNTHKSQWLHSIGICEEEGNSEISYFKVAVAKVEETNDAAFKVHYVIAFDQLKETPGNSKEEFVKYEYGNSQVAISFSGTYDKTLAFAADTSSLRGEKGKEIGK